MAALDQERTLGPKYLSGPLLAPSEPRASVPLRKAMASSLRSCVGALGGRKGGRGCFQSPPFQLLCSLFHLMLPRPGVGGSTAGRGLASGPGACTIYCLLQQLLCTWGWGSLWHPPPRQVEKMPA